MSALPEPMYRRFLSHRAYDALGSVRMVTDASGEVVAQFEYSAFGETLDGSVDDVPGGTPFGFVGALGVRTDAITGLICMRNRWYDPSQARFISRDPIGIEGGGNRYAYVGNCPVRYLDPHGLFRIDPGSDPSQIPGYIKYWEEITGYTLVLDGWEIVIDETKPVNWCGTSGSARQLLRQMIRNRRLTIRLLRIKFIGTPGVLNNDDKFHHGLDIDDVTALYGENKELALSAFLHENAEAHAISKSPLPANTVRERRRVYDAGHAAAINAENAFLSDVAPQYHRPQAQITPIRDSSGRSVGGIIDYGSAKLKIYRGPAGSISPTFIVK